MPAEKFNWIGLCVTDPERSRMFYEKVFGFSFERDLDVEGDAGGKLLRLKGPVKMKAVYLRKDGLCLELLYYSQPGMAKKAERPMNQPGLTHISLQVSGLDALLKDVQANGGKVLQDTYIKTDYGAAVFVKDPDGQLIELLGA